MVQKKSKEIGSQEFRNNKIKCTKKEGRSPQIRKLIESNGKTTRYQARIQPS